MGNSPIAPVETCPEFTNFGGTVRFRPRTWYEPHNEQAVLDILRRHRGESIRVVGALHSWSDTIRGDAVVISLRRLKDVRLHTDENGVWVDISGGCRIKHALAELRRQGDWTLPAIGGCSPVSTRISVDLPEPLPPRITNTSPRSTSKSMCCMSARSPYPIDRSRAVIIDSAPTVRSPGR